MHPNLLPVFPLLVIGSIILIQIPKSFCQDQQHAACGETIECGNLRNIGYPFWGENRPSSCGYPDFNLSCQNSVPLLTFEPVSYRVLAIDYQTQSVKVARNDLATDICLRFIYNDTFNSTILSYSAGDVDLTLSYGCLSIPGIPLANQFPCTANTTNISTSSWFSTVNTPVNAGQFSSCRSTIFTRIPSGSSQNLGSSEELRTVLASGFDLEWAADNSNCDQCSQSGGRCGYNSGANSFVCYCSDRPYDLRCNSIQNGNGKGKPNLKVILGAGCLASGTIVAIILYLLYFMRKRFPGKSITFWKKKEDHENIEAFLKMFGSLGPRRYSYSHVKKITNSFKDKLGRGGYGCVYKGMLHDGSLVAVKVLHESKGSGEEFVNEVASISRTSHVNIVSLLGFCFEGSKRALIFEFMPNGSLEKFIYNENSTAEGEGQLDWENLFQIAVGIARGLEYLHRGCNTRILHFDIKPHNILLNKDFHPKISDFGLAKLCPGRASQVSLLGARGTIGYIAPEVFSRNFGEVSHKSDVYSYGMMVMEMVGGRKNADAVVDLSSGGFYFPHWIRQRLELEEEIGLQGIRNEEEYERAKKMIIVGLWCIQTSPTSRPSMGRVVEMLEGSLENLQIPPKPILSLPPILATNSITTSCTHSELLE